jgi:UDP-N-acetylmuramoyl-tripeptide--D-alanyl-D-alanine ligase
MKQILWTEHELSTALNIKITKKLCNITGVSIDTRSIEKGDMFLAIKGSNFNGNHFVDEAIEKGASLCIATNDSNVAKNNKKVVLVNDIGQALNNLAIYRRKSISGKVIAITGSVGKTSTKEMLKLALSNCGKTFASTKNLNNHYGLPLSLIQTPVNTEFCVLELGMSVAGEIKSLSKIAQPNIAIITNIQPVHLKSFTSITEIAYAKAEIFENIKENGIAIINAENIYAPILRKQASKYGVQTLTFGNLQSNCYIVNMKHLSNGNTLVNINCSGEHIQQKFNKDIGEHLIYNSLAVFVCLNELNLKVAQKALKNFKPCSGRGAIINLSKGVTLIDESYNSSPSAVAASIKNLISRKKNKSPTIAILGDMNELGEEEVEFHKNINIDGVDKVFCIGKLMKNLYDMLPEDTKGAHTKTAEEMSKIINEHISDDNTILIKGSNSMNMTVIVDKIKKAFEKE